jgi:hypothetical protein
VENRSRVSRWLADPVSRTATSVMACLCYLRKSSAQDDGLRNHREASPIYVDRCRSSCRMVFPANCSFGGRHARPSDHDLTCYHRRRDHDRRGCHHHAAAAHQRITGGGRGRLVGIVSKAISSAAATRYATQRGCFLTYSVRARLTDFVLSTAARWPSHDAVGRSPSRRIQGWKSSR